MDIVLYLLRIKKKTVKKPSKFGLSFFATGCVCYRVGDWDDLEVDLHVCLHVTFRLHFAGIVSVFRVQWLGYPQSRPQISSLFLAQLHEKFVISLTWDIRLLVITFCSIYCIRSANHNIGYLCLHYLKTFRETSLRKVTSFGMRTG